MGSFSVHLPSNIDRQNWLTFMMYNPHMYMGTLLNGNAFCQTYGYKMRAEFYQTNEKLMIIILNHRSMAGMVL